VRARQRQDPQGTKGLGEDQGAVYVLRTSNEVPLDELKKLKKIAQES
jgi:hypothetical protein